MGLERRRGAAFAAGVCIAVLVVGCGGKVKPPPETRLNVDVVVAADVNPDPSGRASPVALSILQLKSADAFLNADFFAASDPTNPTLLADVVGRQDVTLKPGETRQWPIKVDMTATRIGVIAAYRDIEHASWRAEFALPAHKKKASGPQDVHLIIHVDARKVSIEPGS